MDTLRIFQTLGVSLLLGLLVGLQRQHVLAPLGGIRTFPLITVFGTLCALLATTTGGWIVAVGLAGIIATSLMGKFLNPSRGNDVTGLTTAIAMPLMFVVGAYLLDGDWSVAVAVGAIVAILLELKPELHGIVAKLGDTDIKAIMQFVLISCVILPVLPDRTIDGYGVINPREIWWMVVLVVGISLVGYVVWKFFGQQAGIVLGGILGGAISSTATAVSFSKRSINAPGSINGATVVIMISTTISFIRVGIEIAVAGGSFLSQSALPLGIFVSVAVSLCLIVWLSSRGEFDSMPEQSNPSELKSALVFGGLYAIVLLAIAAAKVHFSQSGLYIVAVFSGLTDMDAITLSTARMVATERLSADTGWRVIISAVIANLAFKTFFVAMAGHRKLFRRVALLFGIMAITGCVLIGVIR